MGYNRIMASDNIRICCVCNQSYPTIDGFDTFRCIPCQAKHRIQESNETPEQRNKRWFLEDVARQDRAMGKHDFLNFPH